MHLSKLHYWIILLLFTGLAIFLTFNKHKSKRFNYHSEVWADKAGYYVYLPAALYYEFDAKQFPEGISDKVGNGVQLDRDRGIVQTKYTYGTALLQLPFYSVASVMALFSTDEPAGFTRFHHASINLAAVFYLVLGLVLLYRFLKATFSSGVILSTLAAIFAGTNLYFYAIDETGMSHVYSFFLFSAFLYLARHSEYLKNKRFMTSFLLGIAAGLIVVIRPTNVLFLVSFLLLDRNKTDNITDRLRRVVNPKILIPAILGMLLMLLPQLFYWQYAHDSMLHYSYGSEGFNWGDPQLIKTWFAPSNSLFAYNPIYFFIVIGMIWMVIKRAANGVFIFAVFLVFSYIISCWWNWKFGCGFGARNYVEYTALFSIPLAYLFSTLSTLPVIQKTAIIVLIIGSVLFNLKLTYTYDECFFASDSKAWEEYQRLVQSPTL
jgi:hypothetical protein